MYSCDGKASFSAVRLQYCTDTISNCIYIHTHFKTIILYSLCKHFIFSQLLPRDQLIMPEGSSMLFIPQYFVLINDFGC